MKRNKKTKVNNTTPFYKKPGFKYSTMSTVMIAVFIVCIVLVNILATALSQRIAALNIDFTSSKSYTITEENKEYIKAVDKDIVITVAGTEEFYTGGEYLEYMASYYYYSDETGGKYLSQTIELLKTYEKLNDNITLQFIDPQTPAFDEYADTYANESMFYGDMIVECTFTNSAGKEQTRHKILYPEDLYQLEQSDSYSYTITGSTVETAVTSALYYVSAEQQDNIVVISGYGTSDITELETLLKANNYDFTTISDLTSEDIPEETDIIILCAPTFDMSEDDLDKIDDFLRNDSLSKGLMYFASGAQQDLPNLESFLLEWGIKFESGTVYETDSANHLSTSNTAMGLYTTESEFTADLNSSLIFISDNLRPMSVAFEQNGKCQTEELLTTSDTTVIRPRGVDDDWTADDAVTNEAKYSASILSTYSQEDSSTGNAVSSYVFAIASADFINSDYMSSSATGNEDFMLNVTNTMANRETETYTVSTKVIDTASFTANATSSTVVMIVCVFVIPAILIFLGIFVYIRRKRR